MMQQVFNSNAVKNLRENQEEQVKTLCKSILDDESTFFDAAQL